MIVAEYLTSGLSREDLPSSLLKEGRAMLAAVVEDLLDDGERPVSYLWDERFPVDEIDARAECVLVGADESATGLATILRGCGHDRCLLIAPETGGVLREWLQVADDLGLPTVNGTATSVDVCGDKLLFWEHCRRHGLPAIPTDTADAVGPDAVGADQGDTHEPVSGSFVVKPRDGAGCLETFRLTSAEVSSFVRSLKGSPGDWLIQPWCAGTSASVAAIVPGNGRTPIVLPAAFQSIVCEDGRLEYLGGEIDIRESTSGPLSATRRREITETVEQLLKTMPGLAGWIGVDLIIPAEPIAPIRIVEVNPRLTTSYVGYRKMTTVNLAGLLVGRDAPPAFPWTAGRVRFFPDGGTCAG